MKGLVRVEIIKRLRGKKERKTQVGHNMISNGGLSAIAAKGIEDFLGGSSYFGGRTSIKTTMMVKGASENYSSGYGYRVDDNRYCLSCALLGINAANYAGIDSRRGFLPIMDNTGAVGTDAVRATANIRSVASPDYGTSKAMNGSSLIDVARNGRKYDFPGGTGDGDVTGVAMIANSAAVKGSVPYGGVRVCRRMDEFSGLIDKIYGATKIVPPGIDGNGASVRMLFTTADSVTVHSRSLITGEQTDGAGNEWFCPSGFYIPEYDDGSYIYVRTNSYTVTRYNKSSSYSATARDVGYGFSKKTCEYDTGSGIDTWSLSGSSQSGNFIAYVHHWNSNNTETITSKADLATWLSTNYGMTIPTALISDSNVYGFIPGTLGSNKVLYISFGSYTYHILEAWIFSNKASIVSSLIDIIQCLSTYSCLWAVGTAYGAIDLGREISGSSNQTGSRLTSVSPGSGGYSSSGLSFNLGFGNDDFGYCVNNNSPNERYAERYDTGCYISMQGQWTNWMSVKALEETVTKSSETEILVEYDYAFEGSGTTPVTPISGS